MKALVCGSLAAVLAGYVSVAQAEGPKHSAAHDAAVRRCVAAYEAAAAAAHAPNGPKGTARKHAMHAAAEAKKDCIARAPK